MLLNCWRVPLPSSPNSAQHAIPLLIPLHFICIFFSLASLNLIHILWVHLNSLSYQFFYSIWNSPSDAELLFGFSSVFAHVVPGNCCCAVKPGKHVIWPNTWLADLRHCSLHCRWRTVHAAGTIRGARHVLRPVWGHSGRCVSVSYAPYTTAIPRQVGRLGGKGRFVSSLRHGLTTSQEPCQPPQQMPRILCLAPCRKPLLMPVKLILVAACLYQQCWALAESFLDSVDSWIRSE